MSKQLYKKYIQNVKPYEPGKPIKEVERELGIKNSVKLASNENPLGPSPKALRAMTRALKAAHIYPDGASFYLTQKIADRLGVDENQVVVANGSNEIIELLFRGFISEKDEVISSQYTFLVYPILTQVCGGRFVTVPMKNWQYDLDAIAAKVSFRTKMIFIANPNNPTGTYVTAKAVENFLKKIPRDVIVCFDEAYFDFVEAPDFPDAVEIVRRRENTVVLRTFSKSYGLAGLRVGYGVMNPEMAGYLHKIRQPFNVNAIAQAGAEAALGDEVFLKKSKRLVFQGRKYLGKCFEGMGLNYLPSQANFILVDVQRDAHQVFQELLKSGMIIRSMKAYGLSTWIRVTVGTRKQNALFIRILKNYLKQNPVRQRSFL